MCSLPWASMCSGRKQVLDFEPGNSESQETVSRLIGRLAEARRAGRRRTSGTAGCQRWLEGHRLGGEAAVGLKLSQQACLVHVERNIADRLRRRDRSESQRLVQVPAAGRRPGSRRRGLRRFARSFSLSVTQTAALTLSERREEILCLHRLGVPATLNLSFLSTNAIENLIRNWREHTNNIKRWNVKSDMIERWTASGLLWAENGFRRIRHHDDLPKLREALARSFSASASASATRLFATLRAFRSDRTPKRDTFLINPSPTIYHHLLRPPPCFNDLWDIPRFAT